MAFTVRAIRGLLALEDRWTSVLEKASRESASFAENTEKWSGRAIKAGAGLSAGITLPLLAIGRASVTASTEMNRGMANIATLIPGNVERVQELKGSVQDLAIETGKATADLSDGLYQVISAFGDTADSANILQTNAKAAAAGLATTQEAINLTSAVTKAYGDTSGEAVAKAADLALMTVRLGQTTFPELAASIGKVAPLTAQLGISTEELNTVFATLTGVTGGAAEVSTQFRGALIGLQKPSKEMSAALKEIGFESGEAAIQSLGFKGTLDKLLESQNGNANQMVKLFGSTESWAAVAALASSQSEVFNEKMSQMAEATGTTQVAFDEQTKGVNAAGASWAQFQAKVEVTSQRLGDVLIPILIKVWDKALNPLVDIVISAIDKFSEMDSTVQTVIVTIAAVAAAVGPVLVTLGSLAWSLGQIGALAPLLTAVKVAFVALTGPIGLVVAAVVGLGVVWYKWGDDIKRIVAATYNAIKTWMVDKFNDIVNSIKGKVDAVTGFFKGMYDKVVGNSFVPDMIYGIQTEFAKLPEVMVDPVRRAAEAVESSFRDLLSDVTIIMDEIGSMIGGKVGAAVQQISRGVELLARFDAAAFRAQSRSAQLAGIAGGVADLWNTTGGGKSKGQSALSGGLAGARTGAMIGSVIPGLGTVAGGVIGGIAGAAIGFFRGTTDYQKRMKAEAEQMKALTANAIEAYGSMNRLRAASELVGIQIDSAFRSRDPKWLAQVLGEVESRTQLLTEAMNEYGFTWEDLPIKARNAQMVELAETLFAKTEALKTAGIDYTEILKRQADDYVELARTAQRTGTEIPAHLRPVLQQLSDMGLLVDKTTGEMIDMGELTFAETLTQGFMGVKTAIYDLRDALMNDLGGALDNLGRRRVTIPVSYEVEAPETVTPGATSSFRDPSRPVEITMNIDGRTAARTILPHLPDEVELNTQ